MLPFFIAKVGREKVRLDGLFMILEIRLGEAEVFLPRRPILLTGRLENHWQSRNFKCGVLAC